MQMDAPPTQMTYWQNGMKKYDQTTCVYKRLT
jgi:hypothetical protein